jgi:hypothetical protein
VAQDATGLTAHVMRVPQAAVAAVVLLALYAAAFLALPVGVFYSPDEGTKYLQLRSIGWRDGLTYAVPYGGAAVDPGYAFYPTHCRHQDLYPLPQGDGAVGFQWPIWFSLATRPPFALWGLPGLYVVPLLSGWLAALLSGRLAGLYDRRLAPLAILTVGLATPLAFFSLTYWEHTLATLLGLAAVVLIAEHERRRAWLAAPLLLAAVCLRIELVAFAVAVALAWWLTRRTSAPAGIRTARRLDAWTAAYAVAIAVASIAAARFIPFRHAWALSELPDYLWSAVAKLPHLPGVLVAVLIDAPGHSAPDLPSWLRAAALLAFAAAAAAAFLRPPRLATAVGLTASGAALVFSAGLGAQPRAYISLHGLLPVSPFVILAAWAVADAWRGERVAHRFLAAVTGLYLLFGLALLFIFTTEPDGAYRTGLEWGNRYLMLLYPLGSVLALAGIQIWRRATDGAPRQLVTAVAAGLLLCGLQMELRGLWVQYGSRSLVAEWQAALAADGPVVSDIWWLPAAMAPYFADRPMFCVRDRAELASWMAVAHGHGVEAFSLASFRDLAPASPAAAEFAVIDAGRGPVTGLRITRYRLADAVD